MNNKILQLLLIPVLLLAAIWTTNYIVTLPVFFQIYAGIIGVVLMLLITIGRDLGFDFKFLCLLLVGYALGGKGFAYITPAEPFFIGEVVLVICLFGLVIRYFRGASLLPTHIHWAVFGWMTVVALYLMEGFPTFGMDAIKDSAIGYYGLFFMISYAMFQNPATVQTFGKIVKIMVYFGYIGGTLFALGFMNDLLMVAPYIQKFFLPHPDSFLPLVAAGTLWGIIQGTARRSLPLLAIGVVGMVVLLLSKTAGIFCFGCCFLLMVFVAKRTELLIASVAGGAIAAVAVAIMVVGESKFFEEKIMASDQIQTISDVGSASGEANDTTSDWRISWWTIIAEDTIQNNPLMGSGMGSDISTHFVQSVMRLEDASDFPRYPHCILFTVLGRMGFVGLGIFLIFYGTMLKFSVTFVRAHFRMKDVDATALIAFGIFFAGLVNSLIQATYEPPFAAIPHWVCLGFLVAYHQKHKIPARVYQPFRSNLAKSATA